MRTRPLGKTGLNVSEMCLGGAALGDMYRTLGPGDAVATVRAAIDAGVNLIDTSPFYGLTRSESVIGEALRDGWREKTYLCTKAGRDTAVGFDFTPAHIEGSVDASLKRLGTDYVDVLIAHDIEFADDFEAVFNDTAECLHRLKQKGKCRFVGMSGYPLGILNEAIRRCHLDVVISYCHFSLQNTRLVTELLPVAEEHGVGLLNASPLSMGLLTDQGPPDWHPAPPELRAAARDAASYCRKHGTDISTVGMAFAFSEPRIATTISGAATVAELRRNLDMLGVAPDPDMVAGVRERFGTLLDVTWPSGRWHD